MSGRKLLPLIFLAAIALAACSGSTPTAISPPTATNVPTIAPTSTIASTATTAATGTAAATEKPAATVAAATTTSASDVVDATHARLRVVLSDVNGPNTDFVVNGAVAVNAGQQQKNIPPGYFTAYLFLAPGSYSVAMPPTGQPADQSLVPPVSASLVAGHRYTLVLMGQVANKDLKPLLIDETAVTQKLGAGPTDNVVIIPNNLVGAAGVDVAWNEKTINTNIPYGGYAAGAYPPGNGHIHLSLASDPSKILFDDPGDWREPGVFNIAGLVGKYPGSPDTDWTIFGTAPCSDLSLLPFLQGFSGKNLKIGDNPTSFDTLLTAIKTAGLTDLYTSGGPLLLLAPTDAAFAAMPKADRDALLADPAALAKMLRSHTVAGYYPRGNLAVTPGGTIQRNFTSLDGSKIDLGDSFIINGEELGDYDSFFIADGTQVHPINAVKLPAAP